MKAGLPPILSWPKASIDNTYFTWAGMVWVARCPKGSCYRVRPTSSLDSLRFAGAIPACVIERSRNRDRYDRASFVPPYCHLYHRSYRSSEAGGSRAAPALGWHSIELSRAPNENLPCRGSPGRTTGAVRYFCPSDRRQLGSQCSPVRQRILEVVQRLRSAEADEHERGRPRVLSRHWGFHARQGKLC